MKTIFLITLQCFCIAFHSVELKTIQTSSTSDLITALRNASPGDKIILEGGTYQGDFRVNVDRVTLSGGDGNGAEIIGTVPITISANGVTIESLVVKGKNVAVEASGQKVTLRSLSVYGDVIINSPGFLMSAVKTRGNVRVDSDGGKISANKIDDVLKLNGCDITLEAVAYGKLENTRGCPIKSSSTSKDESSDCKWFHFYRSCFWG